MPDLTITEDVTTTSTDTDNLTGEERPSRMMRRITVALDGRTERLSIDGFPLRDGSGREMWMWMHSLGGGSSHGSSADSMDEAVRDGLADVYDLECSGTSSYLTVLSYPKGSKRASVHLCYRRPNVALGKPWHGMTICGRVIDGHRIGRRLDGGLTLCGNCRRSA